MGYRKDIWRRGEGLLLWAFLALAFGCSSTPPIKSVDRSSVKTRSFEIGSLDEEINPIVKLTPTPTPVEAPSAISTLNNQFQNIGLVKEVIRQQQGTSSSSEGEVAMASAASAAGVVNFNVLLVMVDFMDSGDRKGVVGPAFFESLMFGQGSHSAPSVRHYYEEITKGVLNLTGVDSHLPSNLSCSGCADGWIRLQPHWEYYASPGGTGPVNNTQVLARDVVKRLHGYSVAQLRNGSAYVSGTIPDYAPIIDDLTPYDNNGDGYVDGLVIVTAGPSHTFRRDPYFSNHTWDTSAAVLAPGGKKVHSFSILSEAWKKSGETINAPVTMGVFAHEIGHLFFGLPDLYDRDLSSSGIGGWGLMGLGMWNGPYDAALGITLGNAMSPAHPCAWAKVKMGLSAPVYVSDNRTISNVSIPGSEYFDDSIFHLQGKNGEYFLLEHRRKVGYDRYLRGEGLLIWHVDESQEHNDSARYPGSTGEKNYKVALVQADGNFELDKFTNQAGDTGDPFPGTDNVTSFVPGAGPINSDLYDGTATSIEVSNIVYPAASGPPSSLGLKQSFSALRFDDQVFDIAFGNVDDDAGDEVGLIVGNETNRRFLILDPDQGYAQLNVETGERWKIDSKWIDGSDIEAIESGSPVVKLVGGYPTHIAFGDVDGDGRGEVAVMTRARMLKGDPTKVRWFVFSTAGEISKANWINPEIGDNGGSAGAPRFNDIALGDVDGDGLDELIVIRSTSVVGVSKWFVMNYIGNLNFVAGNSPQGETWDSAPTALALGDVDGDGKAEIVISTDNIIANSARFYMMSHISGTSFGETSGVISASWDSPVEKVALGDLNADGQKEIALLRTGGTGEKLFLLDAAFHPVPLTTDQNGSAWADHPTDAAFGDLNGDGRDEIAVTRSDSSLGVERLMALSLDSGGGIMVDVTGSFDNGASWGVGYFGSSVAFGRLIASGEPSVLAIGRRFDASSGGNPADDEVRYEILENIPEMAADLFVPESDSLVTPYANQKVAGWIDVTVLSSVSGTTFTAQLQTASSRGETVQVVFSSSAFGEDCSAVRGDGCLENLSIDSWGLENGVYDLVVQGGTLDETIEIEIKNPSDLSVVTASDYVSGQLSSMIDQLTWSLEAVPGEENYSAKLATIWMDEEYFVQEGKKMFYRWRGYSVVGTQASIWDAENTYTHDSTGVTAPGFRRCFKVEFDVYDDQDQFVETRQAGPECTRMKRPSGIPETFSVEGIRNGIRLTWSAVANTAYYRMYIADMFGNVHNTPRDGSLSYIFSANGGTTLCFRVHAFNDAGGAVDSFGSAAYTESKCATAKSEPVNDCDPRLFECSKDRDF